MKHCLFFSLLLLSYALQAQEFESHENGLIYDASTMQQLAHIVDSLNLKHKTCEEFPSFQTHTQGEGTFISLKLTNENRAPLLQDLEKGITLEAFQQKYNPEVTPDCYIIHDAYKNELGNKVLLFRNVNTSGWYDLRLSVDNPLAAYKNLATVTWVYDREAIEGDGSNFKAFYFPNGLKTAAMPQKYAQLVAYVDCLMDPTIEKLTYDSDNDTDFWRGLPKNWQKLPQKEQKALLDTLRAMRVVGFCSHDSSPREHAVAIASVAAHAVEWEVFLRAHLDVLNDKFERMSDGSYAFGSRQTYLKELEALNINSSDLLLGIMLRVEHPAPHHYWGNVGRLGRALVESKHKTATLEQLLSMIKDTQLDNYNRRIAANLYFSYLYHLPQKAPSWKRDIQAAKEAIQHLPSYLKKGLTFENWDKKEKKEKD